MKIEGEFRLRFSLFEMLKYGPKLLHALSLLQNLPSFVLTVGKGLKWFTSNR